MDPADGDLTLRPRCIPSGSGDEIADSFDPELIVRWLKARGDQGRLES
jgi:hypothetical protein